MTILLGDFLRESLSLGAAERIPLARELALAQKYLEIERVRLGDRLQVAIDGGDAGDCLVPPLLLQPIVENAVTHGVAHVLEGGTVHGHVRAAPPSRLTIVVENPADADRPRQDRHGPGADQRPLAAARAVRRRAPRYTGQSRTARGASKSSLPAVA